MLCLLIIMVLVMMLQLWWLIIAIDEKAKSFLHYIDHGIIRF